MCAFWRNSCLTWYIHMKINNHPFTIKPPAPREGGGAINGTFWCVAMLFVMWIGGGGFDSLCILEGGSLIVAGTEKRTPHTRCDKNVSKRTTSGSFSQYFLAIPSDLVFGVCRLCQKIFRREGRRISNTPCAEGRWISNTPWAEGRRKFLLAFFIRFLLMAQYERNNVLKRMESCRLGISFRKMI